MVLLTISDIAVEFKVSRDTAKKKLDDAGVKTVASGRRRAYRLLDVIPVLTGVHGNEFARRARAQTELLELDLKRKCGELLVATDVAQEWSRVLKMIALELDVLPDEIERDIGASPAIIGKIEAKIDVIRERMYESIAGQRPKADP